MKRALGISLVVAFAISALAAPVTATKPADPGPPDGLHKVWICHRTLSETNPFVVIPVDIATWDDDNNGHKRPHNNAPLDRSLGPVVKGEPKPSATLCGCDSATS